MSSSLLELHAICILILLKFIYLAWNSPCTTDIYSTSYLMVSNQHLKITVSKAKILIFLTKSASPTVFLISINAYFMHPMFKLKFLESSLTLLFHTPYPENIKNIQSPLLLFRLIPPSYLTWVITIVF